MAPGRDLVYGHRGYYPDPAQAKAITAWAKEYWETVHPYTVGGAYVNFMMEEGVDRDSFGFPQE